MKSNFFSKLIEHVDYQFLICVTLIIVIGLFNLYSATFNLSVAKYFKAQLLWVGLGVLVAILFAVVDYRLLDRFAYPLYFITNLVLIAVLLVGRVSQGAQRWIELGGVAVQPSEFAKISVIVVLAKYLHTHRGRGKMNFVELLFPLMLMAIPFLLILKQPDLGTALVLLFSAFAMVVFSGIEKKIIALAIIAVLAFSPIAWNFVLRPYQKERVTTFLNPEKHPQDMGYQVIQSKIAVGSGMLFGKGYLKGTQSKLQFLPKQHTDFIFSNFAEEFGFLGTVVLLLLYLYFAVAGLQIASTAREVFGMFIALGCVLLIVFQTLINIGMEIGMLPVVGMTLPLFSYGGTSLITTMMAVGLVLNVSIRRHMF